MSNRGRKATARKKDKQRQRKALARKASVDSVAKDTEALSLLEAKRRPFEPLLERVVEAVLHQHGPKGASAPRIVEIGSGLGQLRSLLPDALLDAVTHTELSAELVKGFAERHPGAKVLTADATALPFDSCTVDAVLALCVFDSLERPLKVRDEIRRVLKIGGRFVHFLDAATNVEPILSQLVDAGWLPLPNFFAETNMLQPELIDFDKSRPFLHPYIDLLSVPIGHYQGLLEVLTQANHPMKDMLERYARPFLVRPFDSLLAARAFVALTGNVQSSRPLSQALTSLVSTLSAPRYSSHLPFDLRPHSTLTYFQQHLEQIFSEQAGFARRMSSVVYARDFERNVSDPVRAHLLRVGIMKRAADWPIPLGTPVESLHPQAAAANEPDLSPNTHVLREAAVYCFVAEKIQAEGPRLPA